MLAKDALKEASEDNIRYVELRASWGITGKERFSVSDFLKSLAEAFDQAEKEYNIVGRVVLGITRHLVGRHQPWFRKKLYKQILSAACNFKDECVVGFDLSGEEQNYAPIIFKDFFLEAKNMGFGVSIHCGETTGPEDIWEAIIDLSADRIAHGLGASKDQDLLSYISEKRIPLEICPTSNYLIKAIPSLREHPIREFKEKGIRITVNTDNPVTCQTSLSREYDNLMKLLQFTLIDVRRTVENALEASFAPPELKDKIKKNMSSSIP